MGKVKVVLQSHSLSRMEHSHYDASMSVAKATLHLLRCLLKEHNLAVWKRIQILSGIITLLGNSILLAKRSSSTAEFASDSNEAQSKVQEYRQLFQAALQSLRGSLDKQFHLNLLDASSSTRHSELQVTLH